MQGGQKEEVVARGKEEEVLSRGQKKEVLARRQQPYGTFSSQEQEDLLPERVEGHHQSVYDEVGGRRLMGCYHGLPDPH